MYGVFHMAPMPLCYMWKKKFGEGGGGGGGGGGRETLEGSMGQGGGAHMGERHCWRGFWALEDNMARISKVFYLFGKLCLNYSCICCHTVYSNYTPLGDILRPKKLVCPTHFLTCPKISNRP